MRGLELPLRLRVADLRLVHLLARERARLEELLAAVDQLLRGVERLARGREIGLGLQHLLGHADRLRGSEIRLGLPVLPLARQGGRDEVPVLEDGEELPLFHVIAAVHEEPPHRRRDFRRDVRLIARIEDRVGGDDAADAAANGRRHLDGDDRRGLRLALSARRGGEGDEETDRAANGCAHGYKVPVSVCSAASATRYRTSPSSYALRA